jgi:hypothetical protein
MELMHRALEMVRRAAKGSASLTIAVTTGALEMEEIG